MKVYEINTVCGYGSTGRIVVELAKYVQGRGGQCEIAYGREYGNASYANTYFIGTKLDHNIHGLLSRVCDRQGFYSHNATRSLVKHIKEYNPDVIHLHNLHGYYINIPILFDFLSHYGKPVIWTLHDCWAFTGHCTYFDMSNCEKWMIGCNHCPQKKEYPTSYFIDKSKKNYQDKKNWFQLPENMQIVTPSYWLKGLLDKSFLSSHESIVINNGINLSYFKRCEGKIREKYNIGNKTVLLGVASIWGDRKGYRDFLKLAEEIDEDMVIILVGLNSKQLKELPPSIIGIERTNSIDELCQVYSDADFFLNLTYQDNFPTTNIEALACGTPVLTYDTGGSVEIADSLSGIVVEKGNISAIKKAVKELRFDRDACVRRAKSFDANDRYADYYSLYEDVIRRYS